MKDTNMRDTTMKSEKLTNLLQIDHCSAIRSQAGAGGAPFLWLDLGWRHLRARLRHARVGSVLLVTHIVLLVTYTIQIGFLCTSRKRTTLQVLRK